MARREERFGGNASRRPERPSCGAFGPDGAGNACVRREQARTVSPMMSREIKGRSGERAEVKLVSSHTALLVAPPLAAPAARRTSCLTA